MWHPHGQDYKVRDKYHGRRVRSHEIDAAVAEFFTQSHGIIRHDALGMIADRISVLLSDMEKHEAHRFYSASMLLMYEGDPAAPMRCDVRLIDFAHTANVSEVPSMQGCRGGPDSGLLLGLVRMHETLSRIQGQAAEQSSDPGPSRSGRIEDMEESGYAAENDVLEECDLECLSPCTPALHSHRALDDSSCGILVEQQHGFAAAAAAAVASSPRGDAYVRDELESQSTEESSSAAAHHLTRATRRRRRKAAKRRAKTMQYDLGSTSHTETSSSSVLDSSLAECSSDTH